MGLRPKPIPGPRAGLWAQRLKAADIDLASVTDVVLTHLHMDHVGGLLVDGVKDRLSPDLRVHLATAEAEFWSSPDFSRVSMPPGFPDALCGDQEVNWTSAADAILGSIRRPPHSVSINVNRPEGIAAGDGRLLITRFFSTQKLGNTIDLIVVPRVREGEEFMQEVVEPRCFFGQIDLAGLEAGALGFHAHDLVTLGLDPDRHRHARLRIGSQFLY